VKTNHAKKIQYLEIVKTLKEIKKLHQTL